MGSKKFLYLFKCDKYYKIGYATNLSTRLSSINTDNPFDVTLCFSKELINADIVEEFLHDKFKTKNIKGEWFELNKEDIGYVIDFVADGVAGARIFLEKAKQKGFINEKGEINL